MGATDQQPYAALVAVGPGDREVQRLRDLIAALGHYEPAHATLVIVDDDPTPRDLDRLPAPPGLQLAAIERGYAIIHAVKNDALDEASVRRFFGDRRDSEAAMARTA